MSDFDPRQQQLLIERIDTALGPRRPPPRFEPKAEQVYPVASGVQPWLSRPLLLSLVAAACIVAVLLGTVALSQLSSSGPTPPAVNTPTPTPSVTATSTSSAALSAPVSTVGPAEAGPTVLLAGAEVSLPPGWIARPLAMYDPQGPNYAYQQHSWCLTPSGPPASSERDGCPVEFQLLDPTLFVDTDFKGGYASNVPYCADYSPAGSVQAADRSFGGRAADYRSWRLTCHNGETYRIEQYEVPTSPGYLLYSQIPGSAVDGVSTATIVAAMSSIARSSTLPAQSAPLRLYDIGYVRSLKHVAGGIAVRIDRVVRGTSGIVNNNPATYPYVLPTSLIPPQSHLKVGSLLTIQTDGHRVVSMY